MRKMMFSKTFAFKWSTNLRTKHYLPILLTTERT